VSVAPDIARDFLGRLDAGAAPGTLDAIRRAGRERFAESGFPTRRSETWRYSDLKALIDARFAPGAAPDAATLGAVPSPYPAADRLVFVDGRLVTSQIGDLPDGAVIGSFAAWADRNRSDATALFDLDGGADRALVSLNAAFFTDGAAIVVPDGVALPRPVHVVHWNSGAASHLKSLIRLGKGASATVIETYVGSGAGWTNVAVTLDVGEAATLGRYVLQDEAETGFHTSSLAATIGRQARLDGFLLTIGARMARQDAELVLAGEGAHCGYSGAYLLHGGQEGAVRSLIRHAAPNGATREVFKGCLADRAHGVFQGKILVDPAAQKTDGYQLAKTILLGERAVMNAKPELEIYADDVKCSHGAAIGDLDETALFYLRSRGLPADQARSMLLEAFVMDAVNLVEDEAVRAWLAWSVARRLVEFGA